MTTTSYTEKLLEPQWGSKREEILERDGYCCRNCGNKGDLEVHHRQYHIHSVTGQKKEPWDYNNIYLVTLCKACHKAGHAQFTIPIFKH